MIEKLYLQEGVELGLNEVLENNDNTLIVCSDMAKCIFSDGFLTKWKRRILDIGICEQNSVSFCAGIAAKGIKVYYVTFAAFMLRRAYDQLYNSIGATNFPVTLIGLKSGLSESGGASHVITNDVLLVKTIPDIDIYEFSSALQLKNFLCLSAKNKKSEYIRVCFESNGAYNIQYDNKSFDDGYKIINEVCSDTIITSGRILPRVIHAVKLIERENGIKFGIIQVYRLKPINEYIYSLIVNCKNIIIIQEHDQFGSIYSELCEKFVNSTHFRGKISSFNRNYGVVSSGNTDELIDNFSLSATKIRCKLLEIYGIL